MAYPRPSTNLASTRACFWLSVACLLAVFLSHPTWAQSGKPAVAPDKAAIASASRQVPILPVDVFMDVVADDEARAMAALARIEKNTHAANAALLIDMVYRVPGRRVLVRLVAQIEKLTGTPFDGDVNRLYQWLWSVPRPIHPQYALFKARLDESVDPRFHEYFDNKPASLIRLDEIRWGGVRRDGIPPLKNPKMIPAREATWLADDNIVFGVAIGNDLRAYPKRILAWHEMFKDRIGGQELAGVYCTLCGALVLYDVTDQQGVQHELGTSGFLYRSNKLMYDHATHSLWSTLTGSPVVGPLVGKGIALKSLYVVTTTWKEWHSRHPNTQVLSLDTGHTRDYGEGVAYSRYFGSNELMFNVPQTDTRLPHKSEVLALREAPTRQTGSTQTPAPAALDSLAISADFLSRNPVYATQLGAISLVVLTDASGANRVYESNGLLFKAWESTETAQSAVLDAQGGRWTLTEAALLGPKGEVLKRFSAHRAFWFGWHAAFPQTRLIKL